MLRTLSVSWISSLCRSILPLLCSMRGVLAPLLRVRSISQITLELFSKRVGGRIGIDVPFQVIECPPRSLTEIIHILRLHPSLQRLAYVETVLRELH